MKKLVLVLTSLLSAIPSAARIIIVDANGTGGYPTIQAAIDDSNDGDIVEVQQGTYTGIGNRDIDFLGKALSVRSINPEDPCVVASTVVDCQGAGRGFYFHSGEDANSILDGLKITNGYATTNSPGGNAGGGIYCANESNPTIANCDISGNIAVEGPIATSLGAHGGGIFGCNGTIINCTISGNTAAGGGLVPPGLGGGLYECNGTITNCIISGNKAYAASMSGSRGGGLYACDGTITNCTISGNTAVLGGGLYSCNNTIANCIISGNTAYAGSMYSGRGGGLSVCNGTIENCTISGNTATNGQGGGLSECNGTIINCNIGGNTASQGGGFDSCNNTIANCTISGNSAAVGGGLIECNGTINNCTISENTAYGGITTGGSGGGLYACNGTIENCTISGNSAVGIGGPTGDSWGGGFYSCDCSITNCIIWGNLADISPELYNSSEPNYSCIQNWGGGGIGNINADPCFADPCNADYHLQSQAGRWEPNSQNWVIDGNTSPCIDAGNPGCFLGDEPTGLNNVRINMGAYGGTAEASKTPVRWALLADLTNDRIMNFNDSAVFANYWLDSGVCIPADLNRNQSVDFNDLNILVDSWLKYARTTTVEGELEKPGLSDYYTAYKSPVEPNAPGYSLPLNMNDVWNYEDMDFWFPMSSMTPSIEQHGFAVLEGYIYPCIDGCPPDDIDEGFTTIYEHLRRMYMYLFITSDTLLHIYHVQFDETLKEIEEREFIGDINDLTKAVLNTAIDEYNSLSGDLQEAAKRNVAYLAVANKLIDPNASVPALVESTVASELAKIDAHAGFAPSNIFIYNEDYSQYVPRGHYTRSEDLKRYFRTLMWYGRMAFLLKGSDNWGPDEFNEALISTYDAKIQTIQAILLATSIEEVDVAGRTGREIWDRMYAITSFYVGLADDLTPYEYMEVINRLFCGDFNLSELADEDTFFELKAELSLLRSPQIYGGTGRILLWPPYTADELNQLLDKTKGMRFMGQRFIPDSYMFQHLVFPEVTYYTGDWDPVPFTLAATGDGSVSRGYPRGLDVMAILGSTQAEVILAAEGDTDYANYALKYNELKDQFDAFDINDWNRNLYWGWLYSLRSLVDEFEEGYPNYMRTDAWEKKELNAALASWTELRHDTILYAKQSYTPPGKGGIPPPPDATGYVEPVPEFYRRLLALSNMTQQGLSDLNVLSSQAEQRLESFKDILSRLAEIADKELQNQDLSSEDFEYIGNFAETLEETITGVDGTGISTVLVADVHTHTYEEKVVEEGVGYVDLIIVACQLPNGSIILTIGPVLSYYEFKHPMNDRLTDEAWRQLLDSPQKPDRPAWFQPFVH